MKGGRLDKPLQGRNIQRETLDHNQKDRIKLNPTQIKIHIHPSSHHIIHHRQRHPPTLTHLISPQYGASFKTKFSIRLSTNLAASCRPACSGKLRASWVQVSRMDGAWLSLRTTRTSDAASSSRRHCGLARRLPHSPMLSVLTRLATSLLSALVERTICGTPALGGECVSELGR